MFPDPHFNPLLPFQVTTELPSLWQQLLVFNSKYALYTSEACNILVQELQIGDRTLWYNTMIVTENDLLIKMILPLELTLLLLYNVQNNGEMIFIHNDMGVGIDQKDYCYLGGGFSGRDLRILVSKGTYRTVAFPFFHQPQSVTTRGIRSDETHAFIERYLLATGIGNDLREPYLIP